MMIAGSQLPDNQDSYELIVTAQDDGSCCEHGTAHMTTQNIKINIVDSKNFKPQFVDCRSYYNASILEEEPRGTVVLTVRNWLECKMLTNTDPSKVLSAVFGDYIIGISNR